MQRHASSLIVLTLLASALSGCTVGYNGSVVLKDEDRRRAAAYQKYLQERGQRVDPPQQATMPVSFDTPGATAETGSRPDTAGPRMARTSPGQYPMTTPRTGYRAMDIYGASAPVSPEGQQPQASHLNTFQVTFTQEGGDFDPAVSPDGRYLVYASTRHRRTSDIYVKRVDGTAVTQLTSDAANDVMPVFSPNGKWIAFASDRGGNWDIYLLDREGGQPIQLTNDPASDIHPSFSRDGTQLIYSTRSSDSGRWEMVVIDIENPAVKRFIGYGLFPEWSPVSDTILFQRARDRGTRWFSVWTIDLVNGEAMRPTEIVAAANAASITPHWSPDGRHVVFSTVVEPDKGRGNHPRQADVWIMDIEGRTRINLTNNQYANTQPVWAPDGTVYYATNRQAKTGGSENIWAIRIERALQTAEAAGSPQHKMRYSARPDGEAVPAMPKPSNTHMSGDKSMADKPSMMQPKATTAPATQPATPSTAEQNIDPQTLIDDALRERLDDSAVFVPVE